LVAHRLSLQASLESALRSTLVELTGTVSTALFVPDQNKLALYTNNGSLHFGVGEKFFVFASERAFLQSFAAKFRRAITIHSFRPDEMKIINVPDAGGIVKFTSEIVKGSAS